MPTLVLPPRFTPDSVRMRRAAEDAGWSVARFSSWRVPADLPPGPYAIYGEPLFVSAVADALGLTADEPPFSFLPSLPERHRRRALELTTLDAARALSAPRFVKPAGEKSFPAAVYASGAALPGEERADSTTPVLVSEPVRFVREHRCFVRDGAVVTSSIYVRGGEVAERDGAWPETDDERDEALAYAAAVLSDVGSALPRGVVLDVGLIEDRGWAVVELNPVWGSGLCGSDAGRALEAIAAAVGIDGR